MALILRSARASLAFMPAMRCSSASVGSVSYWMMTDTEEEVAVETSGDSFGCLSAARAKAVTERSPAVARVDRVKRGKEIIANSWVFLSSVSLGPVTVFALLPDRSHPLAPAAKQ